LDAARPKKTGLAGQLPSPSRYSKRSIPLNESEEKEQKAYEERLQRRLQILKIRFEAGKIKIAKDLQVIESLKAVRYAPDGSIDLSTVDGLVRSMALAVEFMHDREEIKKSISLAEIQNTYFKFLDANFGEFYKIMMKRGLTPHDSGRALSRTASTIDKLTKSLPEFVDTIEEFWKAYAYAARVHVEDMHDVLKGVFGGDLFPSNEQNIASKCGLYTDTLILPDPFIRSKDLFKLWNPEQQAYYLIKHALNLLQYRDLACADIAPPIVVILPDLTEMHQDEKEFVYKMGERDAVIHAGKIFGRQFESFGEVYEFAGTLDSIDQVISAVAEPQRVVFDTKWKGTFKDRLERALKDKNTEILETTNPGIIVACDAIGRMCISNELLIKARRFRGTPIIDAPTSWQYFVWKLEYDAENFGKETHLSDLHVVRGLQSLAENEMEWLGRVPPKALIEVRRSGAIEEIRSILGKGVAELSLANPVNFHRTSDMVFDNIQGAFKEHRKRIAKLSGKKWKFAGSDIGSWIVVGSLAITAAATHQTLWGLAAYAANQLLDAPKLKTIPESIKELIRENQNLKQSPVGILFKYASN
jgi:hypothetical protein